MMAPIAARAANGWPTSVEYRDRIYAAARTLFTTTDLLSLRAVGLVGLVRFNAKLLTHRAFVLADLLERRWGVIGTLDTLPDQPVWSINATSVETGKAWRFSKRETATGYSADTTGHR
jgi:NTE family protein